MNNIDIIGFAMIEESNKTIEQIAIEGLHSLEVAIENFAPFCFWPLVIIGIVTALIWSATKN
ncbi:hypothetical protein E3U40_05515 [Campylobacter fetus subsp. venerealis]|uniref:hypothetical protein n=1 Tax=Campylobacter fetus TaxID=196 RepID=UPI001182D430|nr:hypothetical protein [Campylobacter fetus]KAA3684428.1 hypothetical protein E3U40_05515 [Campylobacter fetus subsp. venerealis]